MRSLATRRLLNAALAVAAAGMIAGAVHLQDLALRDTSFLTGWLLVGFFLVLAAYNGRKKLPFLPLLSSATWLQLHVWLGVVTVVVFFLHAGVGLPDGGIDTVLWTLVMALLVTGLIGIALSRLVPRMLTEHGERVIFERIPRYRAQLAREAEELATNAVQEIESVTLATFYAHRLRPFFARPRHLLRHLCGSRAPIRRLCRELRGLERYVPADGRTTLDELEARMLAKDNLDYHYAWQGLLKVWLFAHIPLTWAAMLVVVFHVIVAYAFAGATP